MAQRFQPYSRCALCDKVLGSFQPIHRATGLVDDCCSECRHIINKAVHYHEEDVVELATDVWRHPMGEESISEMYDPGSTDDY